MEKEKIKLTYKQRMSPLEFWNYVKAVALPIFVFSLSVYTINVFQDFGEKLLAPMMAIMWIVAAISALWVAAQRQDIIRQTIVTIGTYCGTLLTLRVLLTIVSGVSGQMLIASFDTSIGTTTSNTMTGYLQIAMWISSVMTPIGFVGLQVKKIFSFKRLMAPEKALNRYRSIRKTGKSQFDKE